MTTPKKPTPEERRITWLESQLAFLAGAAYAVVLETNRIHDNDPWPQRYRAPYRAIGHLSQILESLEYLKEIGAPRLAQPDVYEALRDVAAQNKEARDRLGIDEDQP